MLFSVSKLIFFYQSLFLPIFLSTSLFSNSYGPFPPLNFLLPKLRGSSTLYLHIYLLSNVSVYLKKIMLWGRIFQEKSYLLDTFKFILFIEGHLWKTNVEFWHTSVFSSRLLPSPTQTPPPLFQRDALKDKHPPVHNPPIFFSLPLDCRKVIKSSGPSEVLEPASGQKPSLHV